MASERESSEQTHGKTRHAPEELACCASDCRSSSADLTMSADPSWERAIVRAMVVERRERGLHVQRRSEWRPGWW